MLRRALLVSAAALVCGDSPPPRPQRPRLTSVQKNALQGVSAAFLTRSVVGQAKRVASKPPLRLELGGQEEASLVDVPPPGPWRMFTRAIVLLLIFLPTVLTALLACYWRTFRERCWFPLVKTALASAGTAFIKWGQWASTRPDVFPEQLCAVLSELHSQAPKHGYTHTQREVEAAMGMPVERAFTSFDTTPFASGSIAQMHRATDAGGRPLAVKVRHPNVVERIQTDFALMNLLAEWSARLPGLRWLNLKASVSQFSSTMVAQTRLDIEAEHLRRFGWNFGTSGWQDVRFPRVLDSGSPAVLLETFEPGELVSKYTLDRVLGGGAALPRRVARFVVTRGEDLYLKMLLVDNLMHADLHPGNILLHAPPHAAPTLVLIDAGMVARLRPVESKNFIGFLQAVGAGDGAQAARAVLGFSDEQTCEARDEFAADMASFFRTSCRGYFTGVDFGDVLRGVLGLVRKHRVALDANYMTLVMNVLCLEGMARALLPDYNVLDAARPLLTAHKRLPGPVFRVALPLIFSFKALCDKFEGHGGTKATADATVPAKSE